MRQRLRTIVPLLAVAGLLLAATTPAFRGAARDGKAQAVANGELSVPTHQVAATGQFLPTPGADCTDGMAGPYPCQNVDLLSVVTIPELGAGNGNDMWGWTDPETGQEWVIVGTSAGVAFVDVTDPAAPVVMARMSIGEGAIPLVIWRDVKVMNDTAYVVSEDLAFGMQIVDLNRLRDLVAPGTPILADAVYDGFGSAHNIVANEETGFLYAVGTDNFSFVTDDGCESGLHMLDASDPLAPEFVGCFAEDGYTHDAHCIVYDGPDTRFTGREICFAANEDSVTIVDVTDKSSPVMLSRTEYETSSYTHQGWLTDDRQWFLFNDETDEQGGNVDLTATYILNVESLTEPGEVKKWENTTDSIDHNMYVEDGYLWQANYSAGLRVLEYTDESLANGEFTEVAYFDLFPAADYDEFVGAWTVYPFFESGTIPVSSFDSGLFLLRANLPEKAEEVPQPSGDPPPSDPDPQPAPDEEVADSSLPATGGGLALLGLLLVGAAIGIRRHGRAG